MCGGCGVPVFSSSGTLVGKGSSKGVIKSEARILRESAQASEALQVEALEETPKASSKKKTSRARSKKSSKPVAE